LDLLAFLAVEFPLHPGHCLLLRLLGYLPLQPLVLDLVPQHVYHVLVVVFECVDHHLALLLLSPHRLLLFLLLS
jgi:hypothetical protein